MGVELAEKILTEMNSKARIDELTTEYGNDVKKAFHLLSIMGLVEIRDEFIVITEKGEKFKELPLP
jgi:hypothetical protein